MKYIALLIFSLMLAESLSVVIKTQQTHLIQKIKSQKGQAKGPNLSGYPQMVLKELNLFRRKNHYFPFIKWHNSLAATAGREASHIISKRSFGEHANFQNWKKQVQSKFFTELSLLIDTEGMMPPKRIFAKTIIEALKQEQEWYLIHPYTQAGVAILPDKKPHHFVVVIHLIRRSSRFHSCQEALSFGVRNEYLDIYPQKKKIRVRCDQKTLGGGWTRIIDMSQQQFGRVIRPLDDLGLRYTQLLFRAKSNYYFDYAKGDNLKNCWDFNGYILSLNCLKFDNTWYLSSQRPSHVAESNRIPHQFFDKNDKNVIQILRGANKCFFDRTNRPEYCAQEFVLKRLPKGRLNAISDVESILNLWTGDNQWAQYYEIYLR